jgi:hypothetical protein
MGRTMTKWTAAIMAVGLLSLVACEESGISGPRSEMASLSVYLTDAPGDVEAVWVEILDITLQGGDGETVSLLGAPTDLILLTDLVGTAQLLVENAELEPSTYRQLRMQVGDAVLLSKDGTVYVKGDPVLPDGLEGAAMGNLQCPSCSQSGLKVKIPNDEMGLEEGSAALVLDFDVSQSFGHKAGNSGNWIMHPVIHGTLTDQPSSARAILGTVVLGLDMDENPIVLPECPEGETRSLQDFIPTATLSGGIVDGEGDPIVRSGTVAADGSFQIGFLAPGTYNLGYEAEMELGEFVLRFTATFEPTQVDVGNEDVDGVVYTIESAQCQAAG